MIRQFDPEYPIGNIRPKYREQATATEYASMSRSVLDYLRLAKEPMTVNQIADKLMAQRGLNTFDRGLVRSMRKRVAMALRYQRTNGIVTEVSAVGRAVTWCLVGSNS